MCFPLTLFVVCPACHTIIAAIVEDFVVLKIMSTPRRFLMYMTLVLHLTVQNSIYWNYIEGSVFLCDLISLVAQQVVENAQTNDRNIYRRHFVYIYTHICVPAGWEECYPYARDRVWRLSDCEMRCPEHRASYQCRQTVRTDWMVSYPIYLYFLDLSYNIYIV